MVWGPLSACGHAGELLRPHAGTSPASRGSQPVALHFLRAQLRDDGRGNGFGDDVELAVLEPIVDDEPDERCV